MTIGPGSIIQSRYEIIKQIGVGGFATVYQARDIDLGRIVAVKILKINCQFDGKDLERFQREARFLAQVVHPNIVQVYAFEILDTLQPCMIMEYLQGRTLAGYLAEHGKLSPEVANQVLPQVALGLGYAHSLSLVHRDLTPANIFLIGDPSSLTVKLIDFGLSKLLAESTDKLTQTGLMLGTPMYMSPELARGQPADNRSDIYSFGCVMYEALSGKPPFQSESPIGFLHLHQSVYPPEPQLGLSDRSRERLLKQTILCCLQKDPGLRFQTCEQLSSALLLDAELANFSGSAQRDRQLHPWSDSAQMGAGALDFRPALASLLFLVCLVVLSFSFQDSIIQIVVQSFIQSKSSLIVEQEKNYAEFLLQKNKFEPARLLYEDLVERAHREHQGEKYLSLSLDLAECYFKQSEFQKGCKIIANLLGNNEPALDRDKLRQFLLNASTLIDQYSCAGTVSKDELILRAQLLNSLSKTGKQGDSLSQGLIKLLGRSKEYSRGLSPLARAKWRSGLESPLQPLIVQAVAAVVARSHASLNEEYQFCHETFLESNPAVLRAFIANPGISSERRISLRLGLLAISEQEPQTTRAELTSICSEAGDMPSIQREIFSRLAFADASLGNRKQAFLDIERARKNEESFDARPVLSTDINKTQLLMQIGEVKQARQYCRELADRLSALVKAPAEQSGLETFKTPAEKFQASIRVSYQRVIKSCLAADDLELVAKLMSDLGRLENKYLIPPENEWTCSLLIPLLERIKKNEIKNPAMIRSIKKLAAQAGISETP